METTSQHTRSSTSGSFKISLFILIFVLAHISIFQSPQYVSPYRPHQTYQLDQARTRQFEKTDDYSSSSAAAATADRNSWPKPSTSLLVDVQSLQQQQSTSRPSSQEQIPMQSLSSQPDSPSLVKVKSWYTRSKQDVCQLTQHHEMLAKFSFFVCAYLN